MRIASRADRRRPDERRRGAAKFRHARLVAEDRAAAAFRCGIDREHRDAPTYLDARQSKTLDKGRFAGARGARDADADGSAAIGQYCLDQFFGPAAMVGTRRFDERHGAGQCSAVAAPQRRREIVSCCS